MNRPATTPPPPPLADSPRLPSQADDGPDARERRDHSRRSLG